MTRNPANPRPANRRSFIKLCAAAVAAVSARPERLALANAPPGRSYNRVKLLNANGGALRTSDIASGQSYVFLYPHITTPCFLLNLDKSLASGSAALHTADGESYRWQGGSGPRRSIVAFSAICAHKMSHPAQRVSFISYRPDRASYIDADKNRRERDQVIYCCSEKSVYDPAEGARVLGGPAPQPLASVVLDYEPETDELYAVGTNGGEMFDQFFEKFAFRLQLEHGISNVDELVSGSVKVYDIVDYCDTLVRC